MITEIRYDELGVSRGIVLREVAPRLSYNGVVQTLVSWDDDASIACYDDGGQASVIVVESPDEDSDGEQPDLTPDDWNSDGGFDEGE